MYKKISKNSFSKIGSFCFKLSIVLLPSIFALSIFLILISLIIRIFETHPKKVISDKWNLALIIALIFIIFSSLSSYNLLNDLVLLNLPKEPFKDWSPFYSWIGLFNWLPMFLIFFYFQEYLSSYEKRKQICKLFIIGSIPVLISGFLQIWFGIYGPFEFLNGLFIWYQRDGGAFNVFTAMFNNQNYVGTFLNISLAFTFASLIEYRKHFLKRLLLILFTLLTTIAIYSTYSRNASIGYLISITTFINNQSLFSYLGIVTITVVFLFLIFRLNSGLSNFFDTLFPLNFWSSNSLIFTNFFSLTRVNIWFMAIKYILKRPLLGWGASTFPILYAIEKSGPDFYPQQHTHNLFLELALNYGIVVSAIMLSFVVMIFINAFKKYRNKIKIKKLIESDLIFDKAWFISSLVLIISQLFDMQYYDGRISISLWILITGLRKF